MSLDHDAQALSLVGRTLKGKFRLEAQLGSGGMASVWSAVHRNGKRMAIKLLHRELAHDPSVRRRFLREGYLANKVVHPGVVNVIDDDDDGEFVFLVMELLEGETLSEHWKRNDRRLPLMEVLGVADAILDVLIAAHDVDMVHRDIKPANIFLTTKGEVKILDFGIARLKEGPSGTGQTTRLGTMLGSPSFMSPEQARARWEYVDTRTDLWAVGAVMFTMLCGEYVHGNKTSAELIIATATQTARSLRAVWPDAPDVVTAIVDRALAFERTERWQDARSMQTAIRRAATIDFSQPRAPSPSMVETDSSVAPTPIAASLRGPDPAGIGNPSVLGTGPIPLADASQLLRVVEASRGRSYDPLKEAQPAAGSAGAPTAPPPAERTALMSSLPRAFAHYAANFDAPQAPPPPSQSFTPPPSITSQPQSYTPPPQSYSPEQLAQGYGQPVPSQAYGQQGYPPDQPPQSQGYNYMQQQAVQSYGYAPQGALQSHHSYVQPPPSQGYAQPQDQQPQSYAQPQQAYGYAQQQAPQSYQQPPAPPPQPESTTSAPVAGPPEVTPTRNARPPGRRRIAVVVGAFVALGIVGGGTAAWMISRQKATVAAQPPATASASVGAAPSAIPSASASTAPSDTPTSEPTASSAPSDAPSAAPADAPSASASAEPKSSKKKTRAKPPPAPAPAPAKGPRFFNKK